MEKIELVAFYRDRNCAMDF